MPGSKGNDLITDQEIAFAHLILSGTMTDRQAAEAVGLDPNSAPYTKSKPRVRAYMLQHRAAVQQQIVEQDAEELRRFSVGRDQVLARLWDIANLEPERTRNSMSAQVKAISMIVAIEGLIPDRHSARGAGSTQNQPAQPPDHPGFYKAAWMRDQQNGESADPQPPPEPDKVPEEAYQEAAPAPTADPGELTAPAAQDSSETTSSPHPSRSSWVPDTRGSFSIDKNRFGGRNRFGQRQDS